MNLDTEIVAKLCRRGHYILEIPVEYKARTKTQGKKSTPMDGLRALFALIRFRFGARWMKLVSIVVPAYNEAAFIGDLLRAIAQVDTRPLGFEKEVLVVNDGSTDATEAIARSFEAEGVKCFTQVPNQGKGRAVQRGIRESTGDYILVQDADLEYDPADYLPMLEALKTGADSVYGSRLKGQIRESGWSLTPGKHPSQGLGPWIAGVVLSCWTLLLYGRWISDTLTGYKLYPARVLREMKIETSGFETDHEITAKLICGRLKIVEVPISYRPRSQAEGKKIRPRDGLIAVWTLLKFRFAQDASSH